MDPREAISEHPDFPKPGIVFRDFAPLLRDPRAMPQITAEMGKKIPPDAFDVVAGIESRGFILGTAMATRYGRGFVMIRKSGKTPGRTKRVRYETEYGSDTVEMRLDAVGAGQRVLICDDLLATGGTARAAAELVESAGGAVAGMAFIMELAGLGGRQKLRGYDVHSTVEYP